MIFNAKAAITSSWVMAAFFLPQGLSANVTGRMALRFAERLLAALSHKGHIAFLGDQTTVKLAKGFDVVHKYACIEGLTLIRPIPSDI